MVHTVRKVIRKYFLAGLLALIPLWLTGWVLLSLARFSDHILMLIPRAYRPEVLLGHQIPGLGLLLSFLMVILIGALAANVIGRSLMAYGERILRNIPLLRWFYFPTKQLLETIFTKGQDSFRRSILLEYPRKGVFSLGFVTGEAKGQMNSNVPGRALTVFVPTTPNPTSGYLVIVPETEVIPISWTVDEAFRFIVSAGVLTPGEGEAGEEAVSSDADLKNERGEA
jgi:uncharacterized membrane protein